MEGNTLHLTLGGVAAVLSFIGSLGGIWRFLLKPILDGMKAEQRATDVWRRGMDTRVTLLEFASPEELKTNLALLRKDLLNGS